MRDYFGVRLYIEIFAIAVDSYWRNAAEPVDLLVLTPRICRRAHTPRRPRHRSGQVRQIGSESVMAEHAIPRLIGGKGSDDDVAAGFDVIPQRRRKIRTIEGRIRRNYHQPVFRERARLGCFFDTHTIHTDSKTMERVERLRQKLAASGRVLVYPECCAFVEIGNHR